MCILTRRRSSTPTVRILANIENNTSSNQLILENTVPETEAIRFRDALCEWVYICYDRHFPEGARCLGLNGAEIVFNPSATVAGLSVSLKA